MDKLEIQTVRSYIKEAHRVLENAFEIMEKAAGAETGSGNSLRRDLSKEVWSIAQSLEKVFPEFPFTDTEKLVAQIEALDDGEYRAPPDLAEYLKERTRFRLTRE